MEAVSDFKIEKNPSHDNLTSQVKVLIAQGWIPLQVGTENIGTPEYWCALVKSNNAKAVSLTELPKIEAALNLLKTDTTANSIGVQLKAIADAAKAITDLNLGNATVTGELGKITAAITSLTNIANTQVTAITRAKDAIKSAS